MKYTTAVFDFDLTLADSSKPIISCFKKTLKEFNYPEVDDKTIFGTIGMTLIDALNFLTGIPDNPQSEEMRLFYVSQADKIMVEQTEFFPDTIAVLQTLRLAGVKIGIVSTKFRYRIENTFKAKGCGFDVDIIIGGDDVPLAKPDPTGLLTSIYKLKAEKENVIYIGDSYIDAQTAKNAGVDFAGVLTGSTNLIAFSEYPSVYIGKSLTDIFCNI